MGDATRHEQLAAFLRSRRERLSPREVGLVPGLRRRTPGLRREEVAQLSGVSHTWYTWLEQGRDITVSREVLSALARTLHMTDDEQGHLFALAGYSAPSAKPDLAESPLLQQLVDALEPNPAYVVTHCYDMLVWNRAEAGLVGDPTLLPMAERNTLWLVFTDPHVRDLFPDWAAEAQSLLAKYRTAADQNAGDARFAAITDALHAASPEFRSWWKRHDIATFQSARKQFRHPRLGTLTLDYVKLATIENPETNLVVYLPADSSTAERLPGLIAEPNFQTG